MKKGTLRFIPLQADLCLNKQKVDIVDFKGWQKCNAPVYGDCLSPLYKKNGTHHDIYIGNDVFDWDNGVLSKNGTEVLSGVGSRQIRKTKVDKEYDSIAISSDDILTWVKITSGTTFNYSFHGSEVQTKTVQNCTRIIKAKAIQSLENNLYGIIVLYLHTSGKYGYYLVWDDNETSYESYGSNNPTLWQGFNVTNPLIQVAMTEEHEFMVSFYADSGSRLESVDVKNIYIKDGIVYDDVKFLEEESSITHYNPINQNVGVSVVVSSVEKRGTFYYKSESEYNSTQRQANHDTAACKVTQRIEISLSAPVDYDITFSPYYVSGEGEKIYKNGSVTILAGELSAFIEISFIYYWCQGYEPSTYKTDVVYSSNHNGVVETSSVLPEDFFYFPTWIYSQDDKLYSCFGVDYTYTTEEDPDNTLTPSNLVTKTGSINRECIYSIDKNSYTCLGLSFTSKVNNSFWSSTSAFRFVDTGNVNTWLNNVSVSVATTTPTLMTRRTTDISIHIGPVYIYDYNTHSQIGVAQRDVTIPTSEWTIFNTSSYVIFDTTRLGCNVGLGGVATLNRYVKVPFVNNSLKDVDCCMDDGKFYCSGAISSTPEEALPQKLVALVGTFVSFDTTTKEISYTAISTYSVQYDVEESINVFPKYYVSMVLSVSNYMFKVIYFFKAKASDTEYISIMINSLELGEGFDSGHLYPGIQQDVNTNIQGGVKNTAATSSWRFLFNNNMLSNIGCYEKKEYIGTILCDWFTINEDFCPAFNNNMLYYKDNSENLWKIEFTQTPEWEYKVLEDRYIVLNTTNYFNCYDTKSGLKRHYASDYNNRVMFGFAFTHYSNNEIFRQKLTTPLFRGLVITGQNANYEETKDTITGLELGAILYEKCLKDDRTFISCEFPYGAVEGIDLYRGDGDSTSAVYISSFANGLHYINTDLINPAATYPISQYGNIRYNPNLFTEIVKSYNNKDMVLSDGIAYKLIYYNNIIPVMAFYLLDGVEEVNNVFVLQSTTYGVSTTRLYQMNYSEGVSVEVIADITNMEYLGALPSQALFWSAQNRAIYTFQGDCIMRLSQYANELSAIYGKWYNPATQELFLDTNIGILVFSDLGTYCLEWESETEERTVQDIFFFSDRFYINLIDDTEYTYYYSYNKLEEYESNGIKLLTKYYGNGLAPICVNNIAVRLYNQHTENAEGSIKFKGHTITDIGMQTDEKEVLIGGEDDPTANPPTVAGEAWDSETGTMLIKYSPQYNRGLGFALEIETTFPIIDIKFDYVEDQTTEGQISHINI